MSQLNARSPYIVTIDEEGAASSKVELRFRRVSGDPFSSEPDEVLTKLIPASNLTAMSYNISPFVKKYLQHLEPTLNWTDWATVAINPVSELEYIQIQITRYADEVLLDVTVLLCFDGYGYYESGTNPNYYEGVGVDAGTVFLDQGTYNYLIDCSAPSTTPTTNYDYRAPNITMIPGEEWYIKHTNLVTNVVTTLDLTDYWTLVIDVKAVLFLTGYEAGYKVEVFNKNDVVQWTGYFRPLSERKYTPHVCDFINKYGAWQRTWFYKASYKYLEVAGNEYNLYQSDITDYDIKEGQRRALNVNGKEFIKVNTGWVDQEFNETTLKQLTLSRRILIDSLPKKLRTNNIEEFEDLNQKNINYTLEFDHAYDVINSVV